MRNNGGSRHRAESKQADQSGELFFSCSQGALRERHWHPSASEWQYVLSGDFTVKLFGSHGRWRQGNLSKGDLGYIPQGFGHSIENIGSTKARILTVFNTGHYQAINVSQWSKSAYFHMDCDCRSQNCPSSKRPQAMVW
jgi:oxalate decarboxylase/phosphoglucose isomerase-like protein (cupin superfamily)